jgi:hypothetical protein
MLFYFACEAAGALRARHSLRPLFIEGRTSCKTSGETRRENARPWLAIEAVIASAAKQSSFDLRRHGLLRCARNDDLKSLRSQ